MSYISIENNISAFVNVKLTDTGRKKLAQGQLNFSAWAIGDSEIDYNKEDLLDGNSNLNISNTKILAPADLQPNLKSFVTKDDLTALNVFAQGQINTIKAIVNNKAQERGFFSANTTHTEFDTLTGSTYAKTTGIVVNSRFTGSNSVKIGTGYTYSIGDFILFKYNNDKVNPLVSLNKNNVATPHIWYQIINTGTTTNLGDTITLDRNVPNFSAMTASTQFIVYPSGFTGYYDLATPTAYWNSNTLDFDSCCDVSIDDVPVWNMNNVFCDDLIGMSGTGVSQSSLTPYENYQLFGSYSYIGTKYPFLSVDCTGEMIDETINNCNTLSDSVLDEAKKSISIIHYTNNSISSFYGEFLFVDNANSKTVNVYLPDLMWHRRDFATGSGTTMGMTFTANGATKFIGTSQIEYIDLIEDSTLIPSTSTPQVVGMVLPQHKMIILTDDELVAAISYKSNRNWTLPPLSATLKSPSTPDGALEPTETMWLTYTFENSATTGLTTTLPCQKIARITNNSSSTKDVEFKISDIDMLPYMRKTESAGYDGYGWHANNFKVLYQITDGSRPTPSDWKAHDYTTSALTVTTGTTIEPSILELQTPSLLGFQIKYSNIAIDPKFSLMNSLNMNAHSTPNSLQFGDERFFYGNIDTYIGASIYKTTFNIQIPATSFTKTSNPTRSSNDSISKPNIRVSEVGIYDSLGDLVMIGKLSYPIKLENNRTVLIEVAIDF